MKCSNCRIPVIAVPERTPIRVEVHSRAGPIKAEGMHPVIQIINGESYTGVYEVTPTEEAQVLETSGLVASKDIVINPIPSNYGKITWNGGALTVS